MRRLFLFCTLFLSLTAVVYSGPSCKNRVNDLIVKLGADPNSVHLFLGDAIRANPECIGDLFEAAVVATKPNNDTLTQLIKMAVSYYPEKSAMIAEAAVMASPGQVDVIRAAFAVKEKVIVATPVEIPLDAAPTEKVLLAFQTSRPYDPKDVADKARLAIDRLLGEVSRKEEGISPGSDKISDTLSPESVEEIKLSLSDAGVTISTLGNIYRDVTEELLPVVDEAPIIQDLVAEASGESVSNTVEKVNRKSSVSPKVAKPREIITSSVYHIPLSKDEEAAKESSVSDPSAPGEVAPPTFAPRFQ